MKKLINWIFAPSEKILRIRAELAELKRQELRIAKAYDLYRDVYFNYGPEWAERLSHPDIIVLDTKEVTLINYLNI